MLDKGLINYTSKKQIIIALFLTKVKYITFGLVLYKAIQLQLLIIKLKLLLLDQQFAKIYIYKLNKYTDIILSIFKEYKLENRGNQVCKKKIAL